MNKDTSTKFLQAGRHFWLSRFCRLELPNALGSSVICITPRACLENSAQGNEIGGSVTVFRKPQRRMTRIKQ